MSSLSPIKLAGYNFLAQPVKIEYNNMLSWKFSDEIRGRKMTITGCKDYDCQDQGRCKKAVKQEWMALDDAEHVSDTSCHPRFRQC